MMRRLLVGVVLIAGGCLPRVDEGTSEVGFDPFGPHSPPPVKRQVSYAPASGDLCERVDFIGRKILGANQTGLRPSFATIGSPNPEIFHQDTALIYVTSGLVQQCKSEADLAAVLSLEIGKMVSEREAAVPTRTRKAEPLAPIAVPIGNSSYPGYAGNSDLTYLAEAAKHEKEYPRGARRLPPPDPYVLARAYLENAGYPKDQLDSLRPILLQAERNFDLEQQFRGIPQGNWRP